MLNHLRGRITTLMIVASLIAVITIAIISNITLSNKFDEYLTSQKQNRVDDVVDLIKNSYRENNWDKSEMKNMKFSPVAKGFDILVKNNEGDVILSITRNNSNMHEHMMDMMGMDSDSGNNYVVKKIDLQEDNKKIGEIEIGYSDSLVVGDREIEFIKEINKSILYSAIISIIVAILLGVYFSKFISKPIIDVKNTTNELSHGNLDISVESRSKIEELNQLTASINYLKESLKTENKLRKRLTSDISHELRTPLAILKSHMEAISDGIWELDKERINTFQKEIDRLILLVEQLKLLNNIREHKMKLELSKIDLNPMIEEIIDGFEISFKKKNIKLENNLKESVCVLADNNKIKQVLINLFSNAVKFTPQNGKVNIYLDDDNNYGMFKIKNTGEGIDKKDMVHVFERLYRTDLSRNRDRGGTGLGLAIVKEIIESHDGYVKVESEKGKWTEFIIALPK
ncbi:sensor histidine kinase [Senegalia massiliensis]|uniref:sensor histidine kinase n=1 Tax=Senegalia massiliensis TaxID=1720316 RepID=UPI00103027C6|nr:HAMP domain-containing sensor histidine kinase [Senegalia massiliensis]